jgi:hypothetical protein
MWELEGGKNASACFSSSFLEETQVQRGLCSLLKVTWLFAHDRKQWFLSFVVN